MRVVTEIPADYLKAMLLIEQQSNPQAWDLDSLKQGYKQFSHLGIFAGDCLVAFVLYQVMADEAEVVHLVCDKAYQGQGYAQQLMKTLSQQLSEQGIKHIFLEVRASNQIAQQLYQRLGFESVGRRVAYYRNREDAVLMKANLTSCLSL